MALKFSGSKYAFTALALTLLTGCGMSNGGGNSNINIDSKHETAHLMKLINNVSKGRAKFVKAYNGPTKNIIAVLVKNSVSGNEGLGWVINNNYLVFGILINSDGKNLTSKYIMEYKVGPQKLTAPETATAAKKAYGFVEGVSGPLIYEFVDPNCIYCYKIYTAEQPLIAAGKIRIKIIPVGFLKGENSVLKAATILSSKNPAKKWNLNEKNFNTSKEMGAVKIKEDVTPKYIDEVKKNTELLTKTKELATPALVYQLKNGKWIVTHGAPAGNNTSYIKSLIAKIK
jgi:thiol:disulfide interchange protein DsbG